MRHKRINNLIVGGALIGALFITKVSAYNQDYTHPALTNGIVDFYNLNFPQKLSNQDKNWIIRGSIDEDQGMRPMNHFYDPVHDIGVAGFSTSKQWAMSSGAQSNLAMSNNSIAQSAGVIKSLDDFSYQRAMADYAQGDRQRAMIGFGHLLHLLEDVGVPDHTRNDPHPPVGTLGSPYEHEMAKWNPANFNIVEKLKKEGLKPVMLANLGDYFDKIAKYSNGNFFSKDTINDSNYTEPVADFWVYKKNEKGAEDLMGYKKDKNGNYVLVKNIVETSEPTISDRDILDGYWDRLSKEVVLNSAGALNLFLIEGEKAKQEYANKPPEKNWFARLLGLMGIVTTLNVVNPQGVDNLSDSDSMVTPTSEVTNQQVSPTPVVTKTPVTNVTIVSPSVSPPKTPAPTPKPSATPTPPPTPKLPTVKKSGRVVINEIAWAGTSASATDEWIELYNTETTPIDISSWQLVSSNDSPDIIFSEGTIIQANSYFLIERTDDNTVSDITADLAVGFGQGGLNNSGEMVRLFDSAGTVVDIVGGIGEAWYFGDSTSKNSMERIDPMKLGNIASNWKSFSGTPINKDASGNLVYGTPKAKNSTVVQVVVSTSGGGGGGGGSSSSPTPTLSPTPSPTPTPSPSPGPEGDTANLGDIVINEITWMGTASSANDEWIELRNTTNETIDLNNWTLRSEDGTPDITLTGTIGSLGFYVLERTDDQTLPDIDADQIYTGALGNGGEHLVLKDITGTIINQVDGSNNWEINSDGVQIGNNDTKETAQKMVGGWITAISTPKAENQLSTTTFSVVSPQAVTDLVATLNSPLVITWSAPNPGGYSPASLSYDLRYSLTGFPASASWDLATKIASSSMPIIVGNEGESQTVTPDIAHEYGQTLYFVLKTKVINITTFNVVSPQSNVATVNFPSAIDTNSWALLGKDQYHTSFADNLTGPVGPTSSVSEFPIGPDDPMSGFDNVFRYDGLNASCNNGGENVRLYDYNHNSLGAYPCSGRYFNTWGSNFNSSFNDTIFTEFEQVGTLPCGTYEECENKNTTLSVRQVVLRADGWTPPPIWSASQPVADANGDIYFGATDGSSNKLIKLDKDGAKQWEYASNVSIGIPAVLSDGTVYFGRIGAGGILAFTALNSDGSKKWDYDDASTVKSFTVSSKGEPHFTYNSGAKDKLAVLNTDGSVKTLISGTGLSNFSPIVLENETIITASYQSGNQFFNAYSSAGLQLWNLAYTGANGNLPVNPSHDSATGKTYSAAGSKLFNIPSDGSVLNAHQIDPLGIAATMIAISPLSETLYVGFNDINPASGSRLFAINKSGLTTKWATPFSINSRMNGQLAVDKDENVYFSTQSGKLYGLNSNGELMWVIDVSTPSDISPILTGQGVVWGYGNRVVLIK
ncbi:MAG TPA: lamin tail domain-containing protein [Candidatus Paceibacterota bacterium]